MLTEICAVIWFKHGFSCIKFSGQISRDFKHFICRLAATVGVALIRLFREISGTHNNCDENSTAVIVCGLVSS